MGMGMRLFLKAERPSAGSRPSCEAAFNFVFPHIFHCFLAWILHWPSAGSSLSCKAALPDICARFFVGFWLQVLCGCFATVSWLSNFGPTAMPVAVGWWRWDGRAHRLLQQSTDSWTHRNARCSRMVAVGWQLQQTPANSCKVRAVPKGKEESMTGAPHHLRRCFFVIAVTSSAAVLASPSVLPCRCVLCLFCVVRCFLLVSSHLRCLLPIRLCCLFPLIFSCRPSSTFNRKRQWPSRD